MKIETTRIPAKGLDIEADEPASIMELESEQYRFEHPVHVTLKASVVSGNVIVRGRIDTIAGMRCDRCLKWFERAITVGDYSFDKKIGAAGEIIDLTETIREDIIIVLPLKILCDTACRGMCPRCGHDLNTGECGCSAIRGDSPFAALDTLINKKRNNPDESR